MTDAEHLRQLRRLRFPGELENAFRLDHYQRTLPALRIGLGLMALTLVGQTVGLLLQSGSTPAGHALLILRPLPFLATLGLTLWPGFWRWWQWYFVALLSVAIPAGVTQAGQSLAAGGFWSAPAARLGYLSMLTLYGMVMLTGMLRLQFGWTAFCQILLVAVSLRAALTYVPLPPANVLGTYGYIILPSLAMVLFASYAYERLQRASFLNHHLLELERSRSEAILRNTLPDPIVDRLKASSGLIADDHLEVTVLFADIAGFTPWAAGKPAREVLEFLNGVFSRFDHLVDRYGLEKIKTVGDCYMVVAGAPVARADHVQAAARLALDMCAEAERISKEHATPLQFRIGLHTGPLAAGVIGERRFLYDVWGDTVNTASRLESQGVTGAIQVSTEVAERLGEQFVLVPRGEVQLKGRGPVSTYLLVGEAAEGMSAGA